MQADRFEPGGPPGALGALADRLSRERVAAPATEEKPAATAASQLLLDQVQPQRGGDRDGAAAGATLGATRPAFGSQPQWTRMMFLSRSTMSSASAWSSPERRPAYIAVAHSARSCLGKAADQPGGLARRGDPLRPPADGRQLDARRRVHRHLVKREGVSVDRSQRQQRVADAARAEAFGHQAVDEPLEVRAADLRELLVAERGRIRVRSDCS